MSYTSPFKLPFLSELNSSFDPQSLRLVKRKLLAEFELNNNNNLSFNGKSYSKNDILTILEQLEEDSKSSYHFFIFQHKELLAFLETGTVPAGFEFINSSYFHTQEFIDFIAPYFTEVYSNALVEAVKNNNYQRVELLKHFEEAVGRMSMDDCYRKTYRLISQLTNDITEAAERMKISKYFHSSYDNFLHGSRIKTFNALPEYFQEVIDDYLYAIITLYVSTVNNASNVDKAVQLIDSALQVNCGYTIKEELLKRKTEIANFRISSTQRTSSPTPTSTDSDSGSGFGKGVYAVIVIIVIFLRIILASRGCSSSHSSYDYTPPKVYIPEQTYDYSSTTAVSEDLFEAFNTFATDLTNAYDSVQIPENADEKRPANSTVLYKERFDNSADEFAPTKESYCTIYNITPYDAVVLTGNPGNNDFAKYLRSQDSLRIYNMGASDNTSKCYFFMGTGWVPNVKFEVENAVGDMIKTKGLFKSVFAKPENEYDAKSIEYNDDTYDVDNKYNTRHHKTVLYIRGGSLNTISTFSDVDLSVWRSLQDLPQ
jgi:hypothetical protein